MSYVRQATSGQFYSTRKWWSPTNKTNTSKKNTDKTEMKTNIMANIFDSNKYQLSLSHSVEQLCNLLLAAQFNHSKKCFSKIHTNIVFRVNSLENSVWIIIDNDRGGNFNVGIFLVAFRRKRLSSIFCVYVIK